MNQNSTPLLRRIFSNYLSWATLCFLLFTVVQVNAQQSLLQCNTGVNQAFVNTTTPTFSVTQTSSVDGNGIGNSGASLSGQANVINNSISDAATASFLLVGGSTTLTVGDNGGNVYNAGNFAGFAIDGDNIGTATITIRTLLGSTVQETKNTSSLVTVSLGGGQTIKGFYTTKTYDKVSITITFSGVAASFNIYYALMRGYCANNTALVCNTSTPISTTAYPVAIDLEKTGITGGLAIGNIVTPENVIDGSNTTDYGSINLTAALAGSASIAVKNPVNSFPAGTFAGFTIQNADALNASLLGAITITTYERDANGVEQVRDQIVGSAGSLLSVALLNNTGLNRIGFVTTKSFDEIQFTINQTGVSLGVTRLFNVFVESLCNDPELVNCNTPTYLSNPTNSIFINNANTGITSTACVNCTITDADNLLTSSLTDYAQINLTAGVANTGRISVKNGGRTYPAGTFAGFDIQDVKVVGVTIGVNHIIRTLLNGAQQEVFTDGGGIGAGTFFTSSGHQIVGFETTKEFNEIIIETANLASAQVANTRVYGAVVEKFCATPQLACNVPTSPKITNNPATSSPVYIDGKNTGVSSLLCADCEVKNPSNVIDADGTNYAEVILTAGVATSASLGVADGANSYTAGTYAGFDIETVNLITAAALGSATISLYKSGALVQTATASGLIVGASTSLLDGVSGSRQTIGIVATAEFDEVKITFSQLVNATLGTIRVYGAIIERTCPTTITCNNTYFLKSPEFPVVIDATNTGVTGIAGVETNVLRPDAVVSASTTDYARITNIAAVAATASIAVVDPVNTFPTGTFAGFTIRRSSGLLSAGLFPALTISTYLDGQFQESRTASSLLDLTLILQVFGTTPGDFINAGFVTTKPFDEIKLSVGSLANVNALTGFIDVYGAFIDTRTSTGGSLACALNTNPDFNVTNKNVPATGSVKTNDIVPAGTTYGPAPTSTTQPAGSSPTLTVNSDGTYTFVSATPGVYVYAVPVCGAGLSGTACTTQTLTITVLDPTVNSNKPVANPDIATTTGAPTSPTAITINVKANDGPGNAGGTLGTPTIATQPAHGTASITGGNLVYTPTAGYYGTDVVIYQVCETPDPGTPLCATATVTITVKAPGSTNTTTAADDYISTYQGVAVTGNVKTNDSDPEGNTQTVTVQNTTVPGKGTLALAADGTYTFTPVAGATGPLDFTYTTTDNGTPVATANGTLHVLINPFNPNPDFAVTNNNVPATGSVRTNDVVPVGATYGPTTTLVSQPGGSTPSLTISSTGSYTFTSSTPGVYVYNVPVCAPGTPAICTTQTLTITVLNPAVTTNNPVANPDFATTTGAPTSPSAVTINVKANDGSGNPGGTLGTPTIATQPAHGTASIVGGNLVYTPTAGYYGTDVVKYEICETPTTPTCGTATVTITVVAPGSPVIVTANDDYTSTAGTTPVSGNVLNNDLGTGLMVANPGTTITSSGTLILGNDGSYTFKPASGVTGPATFTYTAYDTSTPTSVSASATLHVLVNQAIPDLTPTILMDNLNFTAASVGTTRDFIVNISEIKNMSTSGTVLFKIPKLSAFTITYSTSSGNSQVVGGVANTNSQWTFSEDANFINVQTTATFAGFSNKIVGFSITRNTGVPINTSQSINVTIVPNAGGENNFSNNGAVTTVVAN